MLILGQVVPTAKNLRIIAHQIVAGFGDFLVPLNTVKGAYHGY